MEELYNSRKNKGESLARFCLLCYDSIIAWEAKICKLFAKFPKDLMHILW